MIRTLASAVLWLVAVAALAVTVPVAWVADNVADEDGYVAFTAPFAADPELQDALSAGIADELVERARLPIGQDVFRGLVETTFGQLLERPGFQAAWEETQRRSHRATFDDTAATEDRLVLDLAPLLEVIGDAVAENTPITLDLPDRLVVPVSQEPQAELVDGVRDAPDSTRLGIAVAVLAALGSLLVARRRSTALGWLGLGAAAVGGALMVVTSRGVPEVLARRPAATELATTMRDLLVARATASFDEWLLVVVVVGAVVALVGFGTRLLRP